MQLNQRWNWINKEYAAHKLRMNSNKVKLNKPKDKIYENYYIEGGGEHDTIKTKQQCWKHEQNVVFVVCNFLCWNEVFFFYFFLLAKCDYELYCKHTLLAFEMIDSISFYSSCTLNSFQNIRKKSVNKFRGLKNCIYRWLLLFLGLFHLLRARVCVRLCFSFQVLRVLLQNSCMRQ